MNEMDPLDEVAVRVARWKPWARSVLVVASCTAMIGGCSDPYGSFSGPEPEAEAESCVAQGEDQPPTATREVLIGLGDGDEFHAFEPGQDLGLVQGGQGGYMIVPSVRVPAMAGDGDEACWNVRIDNEIDGATEEVPDLLSRVRFARRGEHLQVDGLYDLLGYDSTSLTGQTLELTVTVTGHDFEGTSSVAVDLR